MTSLPEFTLVTPDPEAIAGFDGRIVVFLAEAGKLDPLARRLNRAMKGALARFAESEAARALKPGEAAELAWPAGIAAQAVQVVRLDRRTDDLTARKAGAAIARAAAETPVLVLAGAQGGVDQIALGIALRAYRFDMCRSSAPKTPGAVTLAVTAPDALTGPLARVRALAEGVHFTRDLVNMPANVLTTTRFAQELMALRDLGVEVEVLEESDLQALGMEMLLAVGQGSDSPSKVVVMQWKGAEEPPLALIGKGVVFDTGGISIKPAGGMEEMTMDMGGAGVVAGVMRAVALRKARAHVVGVVGLVENMPSGNAQRPGDVVRSMKGDTVEVINTDAEGRLVLGDIMWYAQDRFKPAGMVDLATLTGAMIIALGHDRAGAFSNDDAFCDRFLRAAEAEGEGAWRLPLGESYAKLLKSEIADVKNVGGRAAGSITAAEFLHRFVVAGTPWIHLDIAGVARPAAEPALGPKGASGWGVLALDRLVGGAG